MTKNNPSSKAKVGDVVALVSGGPPMTVIELDGDDCTCMWFDRDSGRVAVQTDVFVIGGLVRVPADFSNFV